MEQLFEVDGQQVTKEQLEEMQKDCSFRLKETEPGKFKKLIKLEG